MTESAAPRDGGASRALRNWTRWPRRAATPWRLGRWTRRDPRDRATGAGVFGRALAENPPTGGFSSCEKCHECLRGAGRCAENDRRIPTALARPAYAGRARGRQTVRGETRTISSARPGTVLAVLANTLLPGTDRGARTHSNCE